MSVLPVLIKKLFYLVYKKQYRNSPSKPNETDTNVDYLSSSLPSRLPLPSTAQRTFSESSTDSTIYSHAHLNHQLHRSSSIRQKKASIFNMLRTVNEERFAHAFKQSSMFGVERPEFILFVLTDFKNYFHAEQFCSKHVYAHTVQSTHNVKVGLIIATDCLLLLAIQFNVLAFLIDKI
jgi:hypothetical protein